MNMIDIEFYNQVLVELESLFTLDYTRDIIEKRMNNIEENYLMRGSENNLDTHQLLRERKINQIILKSGFNVKIPKEYRYEFAEFKKGYVTYHYDSKAIMEYKTQQLDYMLYVLITFKNYYPSIEIDDLADAISIEKRYIKAAPKEDCEFMQVVCQEGDIKAVFDIYSQRPNLPKQDCQDHIRLVSKDLLASIKQNNMLQFYDKKENLTMLQSLKQKFQLLKSNYNNNKLTLNYKK